MYTIHISFAFLFNLQKRNIGDLSFIIIINFFFPPYLTSIYNRMVMTDLPNLLYYTITILPGQTGSFSNYHFCVALLPALHCRISAFWFICPHIFCFLFLLF